MGQEGTSSKIKSRASVTKFLKAFKKRLLAADIPVEELALYGSFARDQQTEQSDIDLGVVVADHVEDTFTTNLKIMRLVYETKKDIDVVTMRRSKYLSDKLSPLVHEIRKTGIRVS